ncbi:HTH-type transcriptional regulator NsrR [Hyphomonas johnsonii MHS-2]|uniref:HTH-type transcriptional regulator NsrR n=2 Tax=Hyphomonas johnsonii TaxID=81031 RepID=A0A059FS34_9PROT|nr:HTH-type transcriptional regulator NsrR [Hyphomonas johnsonii MHS-2]
MAASHPDRLITISEIAETYDLSRGHVMKIVNLLSHEGILEAVRGRNGGLRLREDPAHINLGALVRLTEPDFKLAECFGTPNNCLVSAYCKLPGPLNEALNAFLSALDKFSLEDMMLKPSQFTGPQPFNQPQRGPLLDQ